MDVIFIEQLKVDAIIGVYPQERTTRQPLLIDMILHHDMGQAAASDDLKYAIDYHQLSLDVHKFVSESSYQLIEALAEDLAKRVLQNTAIRKLELSISKPNALDLAHNVGVRIARNNPLF